MEHITIPADVFCELPLYAAKAARFAFAAVATEVQIQNGQLILSPELREIPSQLWGLIGSIAQTCRLAARAVRERKAALIDAGTYCISERSPPGIDMDDDTTIAWPVLPNGVIHGAQCEYCTYYHGVRRVGKYISLYNFGRVVRTICIDSESGTPTMIVIRDPDYLCTGDVLAITLITDHNVKINKHWVSMRPDSLEMFFYEFVRHLGGPVKSARADVTPTVEYYGDDEDDYDAWARHYDAMEFVSAMSTLEPYDCDCADDPHSCPHHDAKRCGCN